MAIFKISPNKSVFTSTGDAFSNSDPGKHTLTVDSEAYLISTGEDGIDLANNNLWTVTINGSVRGEAEGLEAEGPMKATIGAEGAVAGALGLYARGALTLKNAGDIIGSITGISLITSPTTQNTIANSGNIFAPHFAIVDLAGSNDKVTNSGQIVGDVNLGEGNNVLTNSRDLNGSVITGGGIDTIVNTGRITGTVSTGDGNDTVTSKNAVSGTIDLGQGNDKLTNAGGILDVVGGLGNDTITNSGVINGGVDLGAGLNKLTNSNKIDGNVTGGNDADVVTNSRLIDGDVTLADGNNKLTNSGTITGDVLMGSGNDVFSNTGTVLGTIDLGIGADKFTGGNNTDRVFDNAGKDTVNLGGGADTYFAVLEAGDDIDTIDGGTGIDTYEAGSNQFTVKINLDSKAHDNLPFSAAGATPANTAQGIVSSESIKNFENVVGGSGDDFIYGSSAANALAGGKGIDSIYGFGGNDILSGGDGDDGLVGGSGADFLTGGSGIDRFVFLTTADSGKTKSTRDTITDFEDDVDLIHLFYIDANTKVASDQAFTYINGNSGTNPAAMFSGTPGELRSYWSGFGHLIEGDVNGDGKADFSIHVIDIDRTIVFTNADFVL